jgi:hypothetical protein
MTDQLDNNLQQPTLHETAGIVLPEMGQTSTSSPGTHIEPVAEPAVQDLILSGDLTDDDKNRVYARLGRPEDPQGYDLTEIVPAEYDQTVVDQFKKKAHESGMSEDAVKKMAAWYRELETANIKKMEDARQQQSGMGILQLKQEFGLNFDREVNNARKALEAYTDSNFRKYMDESGLGNHPALVKAFAKIGRELSEDRLVQSETAQKISKSNDLRKAEINRLRSDQSFMQKYRNGDRNAIERMQRLYSQD